MLNLNEVEDHSKWSIELINDDYQIYDMQRFRYEQLVEQHGIYRNTADHKRRLLTDIDDHTGLNYAALVDGMIIGSLRISDFNKVVPTFCITNFDILEFSPDVLERGGHVTRAIIDPRFRTSSVFVHMTVAMLMDAMDRGIDIVFINTAIGRLTGREEHHLSFYTAQGFKIWRKDRMVPGLGAGHILVNNLKETMTKKTSLLGWFMAERNG